MSAIGECIITRTTRPGGFDDVLYIDRADPQVMISAEILEEISVLMVRGEERWASLTPDPTDDKCAILTLRADNRTVVYRVHYDRWDVQRNAYFAEWPD